ncbi:MAG: LemA family protein [Parcubacteria group bacterium]
MADEVKASNTKKWIIIGALCLIPFMFLTCSYNSLVSKQEEAREAWSRVEANYDRRAKLIPNLVEIVKGYATHERETLTEVVRLQSAWVAAKQSGDFAKTQQAAAQWDVTAGRFLTIVQNMPELKANAEFGKLAYSLEGTENRILQERKNYGVRATEYNKKLRRFPNNVFVGFGDFKRMELFEADAASKEAPKVKF